MRADVEDITSARQLQLILDLRQEPGSNPAQGMRIHDISNQYTKHPNIGLRARDVREVLEVSQQPQGSHRQGFLAKMGYPAGLPKVTTPPQ